MRAPDPQDSLRTPLRYDENGTYDESVSFPPFESVGSLRYIAFAVAFEIKGFVSTLESELAISFDDVKFAYSMLACVLERKFAFCRAETLPESSESAV